MMWSVRCISLLVVCWFGVGHAQNGYESFDTVFGSRYKLYTTRQDWESAFDTCEQDGAHLVVINSVEEASVVKNLFSRIPGRDPAFLFIGITDMDHEGDWQTVFGEGEANLDNPGDQLKWNAVKFLMNIKESCNISEAATSKIVFGTQDFHDVNILAKKEKLLQGADADGKINVQHVEEVMKSEELFATVKTKKQLDRFLVNEGKIVLPEKRVFGHRFVWKRLKGKTRLVQADDEFYYVSLLDSLKQLLHQSDVNECINRPKPFREAGIIRDFTDGEYLQTHPIFRNGSNTLQIVCYYDDVEVANPLGSKSKIHKLGLFYWMLGNIDPKHRSSLKAINLFAISKTKYIRRYGVSKVFEPFLQDIKALEEGITVSIQGTVRRFTGSLLFFTGDTLAANYVGGFKEGVAFAHKPCRTCLGTHQTIKESFVAEDFVLRDKVTHGSHCDDLEMPNLSVAAKTFWSREYGVNERSVLCSLDSFDVTKCIVQDFMHLVNEGLLQLECRLFIKYCIQKNFFSIQLLNSKIDSFQYGHLVKDKPSPIDMIHLDTKLRQNAAQTLALGILLPFLVCGLVPKDDERLASLILLNQVVNLMLAFELSVDDVALLKKMIELHHVRFFALYADTQPTPKCHFIIHMPAQILRFGPLRQQWCMRFEAAHLRFKTLCSVVKNFKNIAYTLAYRQQTLRCSQLLTSGEWSRTFLYSGHTVQSGPVLRVGDHEDGHLIMGALGTDDPNEELLFPRSVQCNGTSYKKDSVILVKDDEEDLPSFACIQDIIVKNDHIILLFIELNTDSFKNHLNAYKVTKSLRHRKGAINVQNLLHPHPLSTFHTNKYQAVILLNHRRTEFY